MTPAICPPRAAGGVIAAERELVATLLVLAARTASRLGVPPADRDDVVQEAVFEAFRKRDNFDGEATLAAWIKGFVWRVAAHHRREAPPAAVELRNEMACHKLDPETVAAQRDLGRRALRAMLKRDREAVMMHDVEGLTLREIAKKQGRPTTRVWVGVCSARDAARRALGGER
jgi:RNA polymerase sigma-70 factor (ECF subfamily)